MKSGRSPPQQQSSARRGDGIARSVGAAAAPAVVPNARIPEMRPQRKIGRTYSRFVGLMKFVLPAFAFLLVTLVMLWPRIEETKEKLIGPPITTDDIENLQIVRPRYTGVDDLNRPFMLTAETARQASPDADLVSLTGPQADITLEDSAWLALRADTGAYYQKEKVLHLKGDVSLFHDAGYAISTEEAQIDFDAGVAEGHSPVSGDGPLGTLRSEGFRADKRSETLTFTGKSRLVIYSDDQGLNRFFHVGPKKPTKGGKQ